jgi:hypothetical protein
VSKAVSFSYEPIEPGRKNSNYYAVGSECCAVCSLLMAQVKHIAKVKKKIMLIGKLRSRDGGNFE